MKKDKWKTKSEKRKKKNKLRGLSCKPNIYVSWSTSELRVRLAPLNRFKPSSKIFTDRSKAVLLLWIFMFLFCLVFAMSLCASVYMCFVVTCWERADLLALVCGAYCEFVTFPLVSWVRCGTWLYRFLIFAPLLTLLCSPILSLADLAWRKLCTPQKWYVLESIVSITFAKWKYLLVNVLKMHSNVLRHLFVWLYNEVVWSLIKKK